MALCTCKRDAELHKETMWPFVVLLMVCAAARPTTMRIDGKGVHFEGGNVDIDTPADVDPANERFVMGGRPLDELAAELAMKMFAGKFNATAEALENVQNLVGEHASILRIVGGAQQTADQILTTVAEHQRATDDSIFWVTEKQRTADAALLAATGLIASVQGSLGSVRSEFARQLAELSQENAALHERMDMLEDHVTVMMVETPASSSPQPQQIYETETPAEVKTTVPFLQEKTAVVGGSVVLVCVVGAMMWMRRRRQNIIVERLSCYEDNCEIGACDAVVQSGGVMSGTFDDALRSVGLEGLDGAAVVHPESARGHSRASSEITGSSGVLGAVARGGGGTRAGPCAPEQVRIAHRNEALNEVHAALGRMLCDLNQDGAPPSMPSLASGSSSGGGSVCSDFRLAPLYDIPQV